MQIVQLQVFFIFNAVRVNQRQHDKGTEHVQHQRGHDIFWLQHGHVGANDGHGDGRHRRGRHGVHTTLRHFAEDIFIGDKVF